MQGALTKVASFSNGFGFLQSPTPQVKGGLLTPIPNVHSGPEAAHPTPNSATHNNDPNAQFQMTSPSGKGLSQMSFGDIDYDDLEGGEFRSRSSRRHIHDVNIEIMTSFLPDTLGSQIYGNIHSRKHMEHHSRVFEGVVMIVDISGFTKLSGAFCAKGRDGIDGLQKIVNGFMGILVEAVYAYGGDVIKFAGDALICIFEPDQMSSRNNRNGKGFHSNAVVLPQQDLPSQKKIATDTTPATESVNVNVNASLDSVNPPATAISSNVSLSSRSASSPSQMAAHSKALFQACVKSVLCAWKLKDVFTEQLTAHIGIAYGDICFGVVGGHNGRWEFLVSGACLAELSGCLDDAPSRNVAITGAFHAKVTELLNSGILTDREKEHFSVEGQTMPTTGNVKLSAVTHFSLANNNSSNAASINPINGLHVMGNYARPLQENPPAYPPDMTDKEGRAEVRAHMLPFVPQAVIEALNAETFNFIAELREVTTVFIKWDGFDMTEHADVMHLQKPFFAAQEIISHAGGFLRQFLVDDKGCVLIAMWGVPAATFPDNVLRALWATVTMCQKLRTMHMPLSCGITTGNVYCGTVGSMLRQEYAAIGDVVNLAARLMSKAHDTIYCDEASFTRLPEQVQLKLEGLPEIKVKGKDLPIKPYKYINIDDYFDFKDIGFSLESFPIRQSCIDVFSPLLAFLRAGSSTTHAHMLETAANNARSTFHNFLYHPLLYNRNNQNQNNNNNNNNNTSSSSSAVVHPHFVVVEGPAGTGRGRAISWLKHNAGISGGVKVMALSLGKMDSALDYSMLAKLFRQFITEDDFDDEDRQFNAVNDFLDNAYPEDKETKEKVAFPTMQQVLGVTTQLRQKGSNRASKPPARRLNPRIMVPSLLDIFQSVLRRQPSLITVENSQYIDLKSWEVIFEIMNWDRVRAVFVFASLPVTSSSTSSNNNTSTSLNAATLAGNSMSSKVGGGGSVNGDESSQQPHSGVAGLGYQKVIEKNFAKLFLSKNCHHIVLSQYSFSEMRVYLAHCLNVRPNSLPKGLDVLVFQLSAGNPLWVSEICEYIKTHSVGEFIKAMTGHEYNEHNGVNSSMSGSTDGGGPGTGAKKGNGILTPGGNGSRRPSSAAVVKDSLRSITANLSFHFDVSFISHKRHSIDYSSSSHGESPANRFLGTPLSHFGNSPLTPSTPAGAHTNNINDLVGSTRPNTGLGTVHEHAVAEDGHHDPNSNVTPGKSTSPNHVDAPSSALTHTDASHAADTAVGESQGNNKLSFLIVCRFAKLSGESQTVLRSASIIGSEFTIDVLEAVTPRKLKRRLAQILSSLVSTSWLDVVEEKTLKQEIYKVYSFSHSLVHESLYYLTPKGIRQDVHLAVAKHMEENEAKFSDRHGYFEQLSFHYSNTDNNRDKEFYYLARTSLEYVNSLLADVSVAMRFVDKAISKGSNSNDMASLLGIIHKIREKIKAEEAKAKAEALKQQTQRHYFPTYVSDKYNQFRNYWSLQKKIQPGADHDNDSNIAESLNVLESVIEGKEREFLEQEAIDRISLPLLDWQKGLIYIRKKKDKINSAGVSRSTRIGRGLAGVLSSFSRKGGGLSSQGSNKSISFFSREYSVSTRQGNSSRLMGGIRGVMNSTGSAAAINSRENSSFQNDQTAPQQQSQQEKGLGPRKGSSGGVSAGAGAMGGFLIGGGKNDSYNDAGLSSTSVRAFARATSEAKEREDREVAEQQQLLNQHVNRVREYDDNGSPHDNNNSNSNFGRTASNGTPAIVTVSVAGAGAGVGVGRVMSNNITRNSSNQHQHTQPHYQPTSIMHQAINEQSSRSDLIDNTVRVKGEGAASRRGASSRRAGATDADAGGVCCGCCSAIFGVSTSSNGGNGRAGAYRQVNSLHSNSNSAKPETE